MVTYMDWYEILPYKLHAYHTIVTTSMGGTIFFFGIRDRGSDAFRSRDFIIEDFDGCRIGRIRMDKAKV